MRTRSKRQSLIAKAREAMLAAIQAFNNPLATFKTESFIVLSTIAWTYLLHAYYRKTHVEYRYFTPVSGRRRFAKNKDGSYRYWDLSQCLSDSACPLDDHTKANLLFLIGLRNHIEHHKPRGLDTYLSARYQACALNFNYYLKKLHGLRHSLDVSLSLSLQFADLDPSLAQTLKDRDLDIPAEIRSYIAGFDSALTSEQLANERFAYRLLFVKVNAKREGQADRVVEFVNPDSELAKNISKDFWVLKETEKPKCGAKVVVKRVQDAGFPDFNIYSHTVFWRKHDAKNPDRGFGTPIGSGWFWYQKWIDFIITTLRKEQEEKSGEGVAE